MSAVPPDDGDRDRDARQRDDGDTAASIDHARAGIAGGGPRLGGDDGGCFPLPAHPLPPLPPMSHDTDGPEGDSWLALPPRARWLYIVSTAVGLALTAVVAALVLTFSVLRGHAMALLPGALLVGAVIGGLYGNRRYVNTRWRLDHDGFALRRGRLWQSDTRVPGSRVQHLDLKRGPVERLCGLATLVIHTAGTRHSSVALSGLGHADAERLRDALSRQTDDDDEG